MKYSLAIALLLLLFGMHFGMAQDQESHFRAFGVVPIDVSPEWYDKLQEATTPLQRIAYIDTIGEAFVKTDLADSVLAYGNKMHQLLPDIAAQHKEHLYYLQKAYFLEATGKREIGLLDEAIAAFIQGISVDEDSETAIQAYLQLGLARTYLFKGTVAKAQPILDRLLQASLPLNVRLAVMANQGDAYFVQQQLENAKQWYTNALSHPKIQQQPALALRVAIQRARVWTREGNTKEAIAVFETTKKEALAQGFYDLYIKATIAEGSIYREKEEYFIAEIALSTAYANTLSWNRLELQRSVIQELTRLYVAKKDYKNAYGLMTQNQVLNREIASKQNQRLVKDIETKYETLKKERAIDALQKEQLQKEAEIDRQKTIKNAFLIGFLVILIPIILLLVLYYQKLQTQSLLNQQQEAMNKQEVESLLQKQELDLVKTAMEAQNKERGRIARELHDSIGGNLAGIKLKMHTLPQEDQEMHTLIQQVDSTYEQVREISHSLLPKAFKEKAFTKLIAHYVDDIAKHQNFTIHFQSFPEAAINTIDPAIQVVLFNIIKELMTNAVKHAAAQQINLQVSVVPEEESIELLYEDDGKGFDTEKSAQGIGLKNIIYRVETLHGTLAIDSAPQRGTVVSISIPKASS
ncbi:Signal transduction histidine kinase [Pustulibacterium marinum]|uniref:histidine kinase n=1 Tax=Pustulibacterium marinum TaxID=1224947 RepID=A0A1I7GAT4_9FLAO|nr:sensor histidine kinase [Pustulibacterium marinum]SFU45356.1 Signal transduction histidine kinase [Pustulibacterium marinum]